MTSSIHCVFCGQVDQCSMMWCYRCHLPMFGLHSWTQPIIPPLGEEDGYRIASDKLLGILRLPFRRVEVKVFE